MARYARLALALGLCCGVLLGLSAARAGNDTDAQSQAIATTSLSNPINVEAAVLWDDNINRAEDADDKLADSVYSLVVGTNRALPLATHFQVVVDGFLSGDRLARYSGLDRFSAGGQGELQWRASGAFGEPIVGLLGRVTLDHYTSSLRSGHSTTLGVTYRQALTDRIDLYGALSADSRQANSAVFHDKNTSTRFRLDYALGSRGVLYAGGEYRRGDIVSTVPPSPAYASYATAHAVDDAFGGELRYAYRFEAETTLWTLGYNLRLAPRQALDLFMRRARSTPTNPQTGEDAESSPYIVYQYSIAYLIQF